MGKSSRLTAVASCPGVRFFLVAEKREKDSEPAFFHGINVLLEEHGEVYHQFPAQSPIASMKPEEAAEAVKAALSHGKVFPKKMGNLLKREILSKAKEEISSGLNSSQCSHRIVFGGFDPRTETTTMFLTTDVGHG